MVSALPGSVKVYMIDAEGNRTELGTVTNAILYDECVVVDDMQYAQLYIIQSGLTLTQCSIGATYDDIRQTKEESKHKYREFMQEQYDKRNKGKKRRK